MRRKPAHASTADRPRGKDVRDGRHHRLSHGALSVLLAALVTGLCATLLQTFARQQTLWALGLPTGSLESGSHVLHDLLFFLPFPTVMALASFVCALPVARFLARRFPKVTVALFGLAGAVGLHIALLIADRVAPLPTVIAATRPPGGHFAMLMTGSVGALAGLWIYRRLGQRRVDGRDRPVLSAALLLLLAIGVQYQLTRSASPEAPASEPSLTYEVRTVTGELAHPWALAFLPDGRLLVTERAGRLRLIDADGQLRQAPVAGVPQVLAGGQGGLMDLKLSPRFEDTRELFLTYACGTREASSTCLAKARLDDTTLHDLRELFRAEPTNDVSLQFGSRIAFLADDTLVMSIGDKFDYSEQAQNGRNHLGKLIRLRLDGSVPEDNPFFATPALEPSLYSLGHRNPQGLHFDAPSGRLWETEHGPAGGDELNLVRRGKNYGWPLATHGRNYLGDLISPYASLPGTNSPTHHWTPSIAPSDVTVYRGAAFPDLAGDVLVAALAGRAVYRLMIENEQVVEEQALFGELDRRIRQVRTGPDGTLYLLTDHDPGELLRVLPVGAEGGTALAGNALTSKKP